MTDEGYRHALSALQFFCFPGKEQTDSWLKVKDKPHPVFFAGSDEADDGCDYFMGIACVFKTYRGALLDGLSSRARVGVEDGAIADFNHRLDVHMQDGGAIDWSARAVQEFPVWDRLRRDATQALKEIHEFLPEAPPTFDVGALVNSSDFLTSDEAKRILGE